MNTKLIILTTAITRGGLHKKTIGAFYRLFYKNLIDFEIYHIINIDLPNKLKNVFTIQDTKDLFNEIIPDKVNKIFVIDNNLPVIF